MRCPPAEPFDVSASGLVVNGRAVLKGATLRESTGTAAARAIVRDGLAAGRVLDVFTLQPSESATDWFTGWGIGAEQGIFLDVATGAVAGSVYVVTETRLYGFSFADLYTLENQ